MKMNEKEVKGTKTQEDTLETDCQSDAPPVLEEIVIEELAVDGICGIY